jgi:hypothetical protein
MSPQSKADAEGEDGGGPSNVLPLGLYRRHDGANQENYWSVTLTLQVALSLHLAGLKCCQTAAHDMSKEASELRRQMHGSLS